MSYARLDDAGLICEYTISLWNIKEVSDRIDLGFVLFFPCSFAFCNFRGSRLDRLYFRPYFISLPLFLRRNFLY